MNRDAASEVMHCAKCQSALDSHSHFGLIEFSQDHKKVVRARCCSKSCAGQLREINLDLKKTLVAEIERCIGYEDCLHLGNLRRMCEAISSDELPLDPDKFRQRFCDPVQVAAVKATRRLEETTTALACSSEKLSRDSLRLTRTMLWATIIVGILTLLNALVAFLPRGR